MRRKPIQRARYSRPAGFVDDRAARFVWKVTVCRGGCVMCKRFPLPAETRRGRELDLHRIEGHHIIPKRYLRQTGNAMRLWDTRNGVGLCRYHHGRHESGLQRVPRELLSDESYDFALEVELDWFIEDTYPHG